MTAKTRVLYSSSKGIRDRALNGFLHDAVELLFKTAFSHFVFFAYAPICQAVFNLRNFNNDFQYHAQMRWQFSFAYIFETQDGWVEYCSRFMYLFMVVLQGCIFSTNDTILAQEDIHLALLSIYFFLQLSSAFTSWCFNGLTFQQIPCFS